MLSPGLADPGPAGGGGRLGKPWQQEERTARSGGEELPARYAGV
jgi:hypothetical protein